MHEKFEGPGYHLTGKKITFASLWNQKGKKNIPLKGIPRESEARKKSCARAVVVPPLDIAIGPL